MSTHRLQSHPIHLGLGATAVVQPEKGSDVAWYMDYAARTAPDGNEGRLVSMGTFLEPWDAWEVHPNGHEIVLCTSGEITLHQEAPDGSTATVVLTEGEYAINDPGVWHTADVDAPATALFITAGQGTDHRPR